MAARNDIPVELRCANSWCANPKATAKQHFCAECHSKQSKMTATTRTVVNPPATESVWVVRSNKVEEPVADDEKTKKGLAWAKHKGGGKARFEPDLDEIEKKGRGKAKKAYAAIEFDSNDVPAPEPDALSKALARIDQDLKEDAWKSNLRTQGLEWDAIDDNLIEE